MLHHPERGRITIFVTEAVSCKGAEGCYDVDSQAGSANVRVFLAPGPGKGQGSSSGAGIQERMWTQHKFTDATIRCNGTDVRVHRAVVCAASRVLDAAFSSDMTEGREAVYEIREATPEAVLGMLQYIYLGKLDIAESEIPALFQLAVQYELDDLVQLTANALATWELSADNIRSRIETLKQHGDNPLVKDSLARMCSAIKGSEGNELLLALM
mmetsp:Transcript_79484/g.233636  ORF Transcript_79484/g.233636 Transcript_79484/m.233636 type:complete len:213 (-) Transcript_79484:40-678(-)